MVSSVKSRPNHYDTLGLMSSASDDDIQEAYADFVTRIRRATRMHPREVTERSREVLIAYKTLRDPIKRREYDASLGLASKSKRQRKAAPFIAATSEAQPGADPKIREASSDSQPGADPQIHEASSDSVNRVGPFIAATLRGPEEPPHGPEVPAEPTLDPDIIGDEEFHGAENDSSTLDADERASERRRVAVGGGALVVILALLTVLISPWGGKVDRTPGAPPVRTAANGQRSAVPSQAPPQPALPLDEGVPQLRDETGSSASALADSADISPVRTDDTLATPGAAADGSAPNGAAETQPASQPEPGAITSSVDPLAPLPPAAGAQSPPAAVTQPVVGRAAGTPPAPVVNRSRPARWISGGLGNADNAGGWFTGTVTAQFTVRPNGQVTGCRATASSGNPALDARTCGLLEQRLLFSPALDSQGRPITSQMRGTYTWGRKQRQKPRR
jgi:protein TonB